jgi:hypothetical protein
MFAIMCGAPWDGFTFYGPFATNDEADEYQMKHLANQDFWWIVELKK